MRTIDEVLFGKPEIYYVDLFFFWLFANHKVLLKNIFMSAEVTYWLDISMDVSS